MSNLVSKIGFSSVLISICLMASNAFAGVGQVVENMTLQSFSKPLECVGGSNTDSNVGLWYCGEYTERYDWQFIETADPTIFYVRNMAKQNRCLMSKSNDSDLRYYKGSNGKCREITLARWRIKDVNGATLNVNDIRGIALGEDIRLVNVANNRCLTEVNGKARLTTCNNADTQLFRIARPGPQECYDEFVGTRTVYSGIASCEAPGYGTLYSREYPERRTPLAMTLYHRDYNSNGVVIRTYSCQAQLPSSQKNIFHRNCELYTP